MNAASSGVLYLPVAVLYLSNMQLLNTVHAKKDTAHCEIGIAEGKSMIEGLNHNWRLASLDICSLGDGRWGRKKKKS